MFAPFEIGQSLMNVMDIDFTATEETTAAFQCEMLLEVVKLDTGEESEERSGSRNGTAGAVHCL